MTELIFEASRVLSITVFLVYGWLCIYSDRMSAEFERYGLAKLRRLTGVLEMAGAIGLLAGYIFQPIGAIAAGCLCLLMLLAVGARIRIRDSLLQTSPALFLCILNAYILWCEGLRMGWFTGPQ